MKRRHIPPLLLFLLSSSAVAAYAFAEEPPFDAYSPDTFPDSEREWRLCGVPERSLICDPSHQLNAADDSTYGAVKIHKRLEHLRHATSCECERLSTLLSAPHFPPYSVHPAPLSAEQCREQEPHGYTVSVAILKRIYNPTQSTHSKEELMRIFVNALRNRFRHRAQCQDDAFIVLSVEDNTVWTSTGALTAQKLTPDLIRRTTEHAAQYFAHGDYTRGVLYMVHEYGKRLLALTDAPSTSTSSPATAAPSPPPPPQVRVHPFRDPVQVAALSQSGNEAETENSHNSLPPLELGEHVHLEVLPPWWAGLPWDWCPDRWRTDPDAAPVRWALLLALVASLLVLVGLVAWATLYGWRFAVDVWRQKRDGYEVGKIGARNGGGMS